MRKNTLLIAIVGLLVLCFATLGACSGSVNKVDEYIEKLNDPEIENFISILEENTDAYSIVTEVLISGNRLQVQSVKTFLTGENKDKTEKNDKYYEVLEGGKVRVYSTFECTEHAKGGKPVLEWKFEDITAPDYVDAAKTALKAKAALFAVKGENLVWSDDAKGFVYAEGKGAADLTVSDVVINAKSGCLSIAYKQAGVEKKVSYMNFNTARVSFPILCATYADMLK